MANEIQVQQEYSVQEVLGQVRKVQEIMKSAMKDNEHYGIIPGTNKPTLLKPGAEKLCFTFRLGPEYEIMAHETERRISYTVRCKLIHIPSGNFVAEGIGSCNSNEAKYRYRYVPTDRKPSKEEAATLKAQGLGKWKKDNSNWTWVERIEHDNPDDFENTIVKMACKRALVAATLNATAASDIFTQDIEDLPPEILEPGNNPSSQTGKKTSSKKKEGKEFDFEKDLNDALKSHFIGMDSFLEWLCMDRREIEMVDGKPDIGTMKPERKRELIQNFEKAVKNFKIWKTQKEQGE